MTDAPTCGCVHYDAELCALKRDERAGSVLAREWELGDGQRYPECGCACHVDEREERTEERSQ